MKENIKTVITVIAALFILCFFGMFMWSMPESGNNFLSILCKPIGYKYAKTVYVPDFKTTVSAIGPRSSQGDTEVGDSVVIFRTLGTGLLDDENWKIHSYSGWRDSTECLLGRSDGSYIQRVTGIVVTK